MKTKSTIVAMACLSMLFCSCFKDEPQNAEADIEHVSVAISNPLSTFFNVTDTARDVSATDSTIMFNVRRDADLTSLAPLLRLTPGATVTPPSGSVHDFSKTAVAYRVTSEDGCWSRTYKIGFTPRTVSKSDTVSYDFEKFELDPKTQGYFIWHDEQEDGTYGDNWATGNAGYQLSKGTAAPDEYPTDTLQHGRHGYGVRLTTCDTGPLGAMVNKPLAAGNLFLGSFDMTSALMDALKATRFGIPFDKTPVTFTGYYTYQPGANYQDEQGQTISGKIDSCAVYAVFYRNHDAAGNAVTLYGDDVKTSKQIVAIADAGYLKPTKDWTQFKVTFTYTDEIDPEVLENQGYSLTVVFSSSNQGDRFMGAIGSTLCVDDVKIICTTDE